MDQFTTTDLLLIYDMASRAIIFLEQGKYSPDAMKNYTELRDKVKRMIIKKEINHD
jgi:hypothetical protein